MKRMPLLLSSLPLLCAISFTAIAQEPIAPGDGAGSAAPSYSTGEIAGAVAISAAAIGILLLSSGDSGNGTAQPTGTTGTQ